MVKAKAYNVADSNIANLGTELEKKVRLAAAEGEHAWAGAGKVPGVQIWRIMAFKVVPVPPNAYGSFYAGDSYIVLKTYKKAPNSDALAWDVFFWLGKNTTQDEAGTAAYKTVELDDFLGGAPVQHREVMDHESSEFVSLFPQIRIMEGGVDSGFTHVSAKTYQPRLLQLKGKRHIRLREVECKLTSVNQGDVFVLDLGLTLIQFNGAKSSPLERSKAATICTAIHDEREGRTAKVVFEGGDAARPPQWDAVLGAGPIAGPEAGGDDAAFEVQSTSKLLLRVSDASGTLTMDKVAEGAAVKKDKLDSNDVFILDLGNEVFAWVGSKSSAGERKTAMRYAEMYLVQAHKPLFTPISRVIQFNESPYFWSLINN